MKAKWPAPSMMTSAFAGAFTLLKYAPAAVGQPVCGSRVFTGVRCHLENELTDRHLPLGLPTG
jgi:hypothetical protein